MRVSSLSDPRINSLISKYFVPVWVSRDDYQLEDRSKEEKAELDRLDAERRKRGLEGGNVCVFIVAANGDVLATQRVQLAYKPEEHLAFLRKIIADYKPEPRDAEAIRASTAKPAEVKPKTKDGRLFHIWTRLDRGADNKTVTNDRVELTAAEWKTFLPTAGARVGASWTIPDDIAHKLYHNCYPPNPYWMTKDCKVLKGTLKATLSAVTDEVARIQLEGSMELSFPHGKPTEGRVTARFIGAARQDRKKQTLTSLALVSEKADYVWYWQGSPQPIEMRIALEMEP
jgi:hypothetical protein